MAIAYQYNSITFEYLGEVEAQESPLEKGKILMPANATDKKPPKQARNEVACFIDGNWKIKPDFRGNWFKTNREVVEITEIDQLPNSDWSLTNPPKSDKEIKSDKALYQINLLERKSLRAMREALLTNDKTALLEIEAEIVTEREKLK